MNNLTIAVQTIKDTISAQDVGQALGLEMRHGRCRCPLHGGTDFNCVLYPGSRGFYCFVCHDSGDVIKFVRKYHDMRFRDAVAWFNDTFHLGMDIDSPVSEDALREAKKAQRKRAALVRAETAVKEAQADRELAAFIMLRHLEEGMERTAPGRPDEPFSRRFEQTARMIPYVKGMIEDIQIENMKETEP